jgi:O-antigen/teichoic acid export membrane protein
LSNDVPDVKEDGLPLTSVSQAEHFRTDHLVHNLGERAVSAGFVTGTAQAGKFAINFAAAAVLARLLSPKEFGLVGMVLGVTSLMGIFKEFGLSTATVQRETITQEQVSNLFWINIVVSGALAVVGIGLAPLLAWFYRDPRVAGIMVAMSLTFVLTGATVQHRALLTRQLRFRALALIDVVSMTLSFATACWLAWRGFAYWSLVVQQLCLAAVCLVLAWWTSGWRPSMPTRNSGVGPMLSFGAHLTLSDSIARLAIASDSILIGRFFGAVPLGLYTRASVLLTRPLQQVLDPLCAVLSPVLSRLQADPERYRRTFMRSYEMLILITLPFSAMCLVLARPLVLVVLGPKWTGAIPLFSAFTFVAVSLPVSFVPSWLFMSQGRGRDQFRTWNWAGAVTVGSYLIGLRWGPLGVVVAMAVTSLAIRLPILYYMAGRAGPVSTWDLWNAFLSYLPCWGAVFVTTMLARMMVPNLAPILQLLVCIPVGLGTGMAVILLFERPRQSASFAWYMVRSTLAQQSGNAA